MVIREVKVRINEAMTKQLVNQVFRLETPKDAKVEISVESIKIIEDRGNIERKFIISSDCTIIGFLISKRDDGAGFRFLDYKMFKTPLIDQLLDYFNSPIFKLKDDKNKIVVDYFVEFVNSEKCIKDLIVPKNNDRIIE